MKPPARAIVGNLIWSTDGGVWAVWRVTPFAHAHTSVNEKLSVHARLRGLLLSLSGESMLLSVCQRMSPYDVVDRMAAGIDLEKHEAWDAACGVSAAWLSAVTLRRRRYYLAVQLEGREPVWRQALRGGVSEMGSAFGIASRGVSGADVKKMQRQARSLQHQLAQQAELTEVTAGELCWLYARSVRRDVDEPAFEEVWEPPVPDEGVANPSEVEAAEAARPRGVLAHLTDAIVKEGGFADDEDRPRHRRYVRVDTEAGSAYQTVLAMSDMPHYFRYPSGGGEWLFHVDQVGFPVDWCVRIKAVANADAQSKVRRKQRDLIGQVDEYDGEVSGAPPQLSEAIRSIDTERAELSANPAEPELQVSVLLSVSAPTLAELEERAGALQGMFQPLEYGLARPTGGQVGLLRSMLPGANAASVAKDYTQFMLTRDLAAGAPFCGAEVGDPQGLMLGVSLDDGTATPVLFDPAYGPKVNASPSLAAVGRLGSGKSFFLKRLCWDSVARGGQVVTIDRTHSGEYARLAEAMPGRVQVVHLEAGAETRLDPLRTFQGDDRRAVTLGFLSLLAGCSAHTEEGAALAEAVDVVEQKPDARLVDVVTELAARGEDAEYPDAAARGLARRLAHYARSPNGQLAFGQGEALGLDADFIVFWAPNLSLADKETMAREDAARMMLPEQVLGQALLYLVAAVGRQVVFRDPRRFAAALYDEAWALLASPHGQSLLIEGVRDGRKHNGAIWLASQHPNDFAVSELQDLLGSKFVFRQARQAVGASLRFLGVDDSQAAAATLDQGLDTGVCLYRDVQDRVGMVQVLPPALPELDEVFNTAPSTDPVEALEAGDSGLDDDVAGELEPAALGPDAVYLDADDDFVPDLVDMADEAVPVDDVEGRYLGEDDLSDWDGDLREVEPEPSPLLRPAEPVEPRERVAPPARTLAAEPVPPPEDDEAPEEMQPVGPPNPPPAPFAPAAEADAPVAPSEGSVNDAADARLRARRRRRSNPLSDALSQGSGS